jgi:hypothetical protein
MGNSPSPEEKEEARIKFEEEEAAKRAAEAEQKANEEAAAAALEAREKAAKKAKQEADEQALRDNATGYESEAFALFAQMDIDESGALSMNEVIEGLGYSGWPADQVEQLVWSIDFNEDDEVTSSELITWTCSCEFVIFV